MKLKFLREAAEDVLLAADWYDRQRFGLGDAFTSAVDEGFDRIREDHENLPRLEQYQGDRDYRRLRVKGFPYDIIVRCEPDLALVVAVAQHNRKPLYWLARDSRDP